MKVQGKKLRFLSSLRTVPVLIPLGALDVSHVVNSFVDSHSRRNLQNEVRKRAEWHQDRDYGCLFVKPNNWSVEIVLLVLVKG